MLRQIISRPKRTIVTKLNPNLLNTNNESKKSEQPKKPSSNSNDTQFTKINVNINGTDFSGTLEKACYTYPDSKGIEIAIPIKHENFTDSQRKFAERHYSGIISNDDQGVPEILAYSDKSNYEIKNREQAISKMKKIITSIITESADSTKSFTPFIGHEKYNDLPTNWKNSRYVKYGPYHDHMQEELNWAIMKGMHPTNVVEKQWHDFRHNDVINEEAAEILQGIDYSKRMLKSGDVAEVKLYPVEIIQ